MRCFIVTVLVFCIFRDCLTKNDGKCNIKDVSKEAWDTFKTLDAFNQKDGCSYTWTFEGTVSSASSTCDGLKATVSDSTKTINIASNPDYLRSLDAFGQYFDSPKPESCTIQFVCEGESKLLVSYGIIDNDDYPPEFSQQTYELTVPMPLLPKIDLGLLVGTQIQVQDKDFSNKDMNFKINSSIFNLDTRSLGVKSYTPVIMVNELIRLPDKQTFIVTATDSGTVNGPLSSTATLVINVDYKNSAPIVPKFSEPHYAMNYSIKPDGTGILAQIDTIQVTADSTDPISVELDNKNDFTTKINSDGTVEITLKNSKLPDELIKGKSVFYLTLSGTVGKYTESTESTIVINLPLQEDPPKFTKDSFIVEYNEKDGLKGDSIAVNDENAVVTLGPVDNCQSCFKLQRDDIDKKMWNLKVDDSTTLNNLEIFEIVASVTAKKMGATRESMASLLVHLSVSKIAPRFDKAHYKATYSDGKVDLKPPVIVENKNSKEIKVFLSEDYDGHFSLVTDDSVNYNLHVIKPIDDIEKIESPLILTAKGTLGDLSTTATISVALTKAETPTFSEINYNAAYNYTDKSIEVKNGPIKLVKNTEATVKLDGNYTDIFDIQAENDKKDEYMITVLPNAKITEKEYILTIKASTATAAGYSTVVVVIPDKEIPSFKEINYRIEYDDLNNTITVLNGPITLTNKNAASTDVTITSGQSNEFTPSRDKTDASKWIIEVPNPPLPQKKYVLTLQAKLEEEASYSTAVVTTKEKEKPSFTQVLYTFTYDVKHSKLRPDGGLVTLNNTNAKETNVMLLERNTGLKLSPNGKNQTEWVLSVDTVPQDLSEVTATMEANLFGETAHGTIVVKLERTGTVTPKFKESYYLASYEVTDGKPKVKIDNGPIDVETDETTVNLATSEYSKYFTVNKQADTGWTVETEGLPEDVLKTNVDVTLILEALKDKIKATVPLVISLPKKKDTPQFKEALYIATYKIGGPPSLTLNNGPVKVEPATANVIISKDTEYKDNFKVSKVNSDWTVEISEPLADEVLNSKKEITLSLEATEGDLKGTTSLLIYLPKMQDPPTFEKVNYEAEYKQSSDNKTDTIVLKDGNIKIKSADTQLNININEDYKDYFDVVSDNDQVSIKVKRNLNEDLLKQKYIVITLEVSSEGIPNKSYTSLVVKLPESGGNNDNGNSDSEKSDRVGLIAGIGVLTFIVVACCVALILIYVLKIRKNGKYAEMDDDSVESNGVSFSKNTKPSSQNGRKSSSISSRRPTGFIRYSPTLKAKDDAMAENETPPEAEEVPRERRKSVAFDDNVSKLQIEPHTPTEEAPNTEVQTTQL